MPDDLKKKIDNLGTSEDRIDNAPPIGWSDSDGPNIVSEGDPLFEPLLVDTIDEDPDEVDE